MRGGSGGADEDDNGVSRDKRRTEIKRQRRQEKEKHAVVLDELAPKETGRQAVMVRKARQSSGAACDFSRFYRLPCRYFAVVLNRCASRGIALCAPHPCARRDKVACLVNQSTVIIIFRRCT